MSTKIKKGHFSGSGKVFSAESDGLESLLKGLASSVAVLAIKASEIDVGTDLTFTDNSTGTAGAAVVDVVLPAAGATVASGTTGCKLTALNTALGKTENALKVIATLLNVVRPVVGLSSVTASVGTVATAGTIPAQDKTSGTGDAGTAAASFASGLAAFKVAKLNVHKIAKAVDETLKAVGRPGLSIALDVSMDDTPHTVADIPTVAAAATGGVGALLKADADVVLLGLANDIATIADIWNDQIDGVDTAAPVVVAG